VNITIHRGGGGEVDVPIKALHGFRVDLDFDDREPNRRRYRLTALILCTELPAGRPFGHSCLHGPPPHLIRVVVKLPSTGQPFSRSEGKQRRLASEAELLARALRSGELADTLAADNG
jgi:hypothetical protein